MNANDKAQLPLQGLNKARLYFDVRLVPVSAADLQGICTELAEVSKPVIQSSITRFGQTHLVSLIQSTGGEVAFSPLRERPGSERGKAATQWYKSITRNPVGIGKSMADALQKLGIRAKHEVSEVSPFSSLRADVLVNRDTKPSKIVIELKAYSPENTRPSDVSSQLRITLTKLARFAGFIQRQ